ncbi:MAG: hypothetical protein ACM3S5_05865 [Rhodospirillales bacterium]
MTPQTNTITKPSYPNGDSRAAAEGLFADQATRVRVLRLFERFINLADEAEVLDMLAMLRYWVTEVSTLTEEGRGDVDLMAMAAEHFVLTRRRMTAA